MEKRICRVCETSFKIADEDLAFYQKIQVPPATLCPLCRLKRRLAFRNERNLYHRTCNLCGRNIITIYSPDKPFTVYCQDCWWSDRWDALQYGRDFDFSKGFFEQFAQLQRMVPRLALMNRNAENSEYCNYAGYNKNCYLAVGGSWYNEDCLYGRRFSHCKSSLDCESLKNSELCYECVWCSNLYACVHCYDSFASSNCYFSTNLRGCQYCIFSSNLRNKSYYAFNKPVSKEEFQKHIKSMEDSTAFQKMVATIKKIRLESIRPASNLINCINCTGDYLENCKNVANSFDVYLGEDCRYIFQSEELKDSMDCTSTGYDKPTLFYETINAGNAGYNNKFSFSVWNDSDISYCDTVMNSRDCFGCCNMNRKEYCILNKQYEKSAFDKLKLTIIEHMRAIGEYGEFFPATLSPFAYAETLAHDFFTDTQEKIPEEKLSSEIENLSGDIFSCHACGKKYRVIEQELRLYKQTGVPLPQKCPTCRYLARLQSRNLPILWQRNCSKCGLAISSSYAPQRKETIYCEKCYLEAVY